jgi:translocation and assembly module TamA
MARFGPSLHARARCTDADRRPKVAHGNALAASASKPRTRRREVARLVRLSAPKAGPRPARSPRGSRPLGAVRRFVEPTPGAAPHRPRAAQPWPDGAGWQLLDRAGALWRSGLVVALVLVLGWIGPLRAQGTDPDDDDAQEQAVQQVDPEVDAAVGTPEATVLDPGRTTLEAGPSGAYRLEVQAPNPSRDLLVRHLDLARFRDQRDITRVEIGRLVAATPAQARALLEPEGYFASKVEVTREPGADGAPELVRVRVEPGPPVRVGRLQLEVQGALQEAIDGGDERSQRRWARLQRQWSLQPEQPFNQDAWTSAKNTLLGSLQSVGYPTATYAGTTAQVDPRTGTVRLVAIVDSGPLFRMGDVRIEGLERTPDWAALNVVPFEAGDVYSEKLLLDYQEALQKVGLYEGVAVEVDLATDTPERAAVIAKLRESSTQTATVGVGFSTNTGPRVSLDYTHRRPFDLDWVATTKLKLGSQERLAALDWLSYPQEGGYRKLLGAQADYLDAGGAITASQRLRIGRSLDTELIERLYYLEYNRTTLQTDNTRQADQALWANYAWTRRDVNSVVFPTRGLILHAEGGGGYARDDEREQGPFVRLYARAVGYRPLGGGWLGQARLEAAQVFKREELGVPDTLLFRAGGDDSVRGYGYRTLGPEIDDTTVGGPVMATGTIEAMRRLSQQAKWRDFYGAVFVDAGNAANRWHDLDPAIGYGVGLRWRSPIGPLRVDLAYGEQVNSVRLHINVGISY